jgi:hypothetical protein
MSTPPPATPKKQKVKVKEPTLPIGHTHEEIDQLFAPIGHTHEEIDQLFAPTGHTEEGEWEGEGTNPEGIYLG